MKSVLISIQPKWVEKIAKGEKTIEVLKTKPNIETPFKCYIYATKNKDCVFERNGKIYDYKKAGGKVVCEFTCDKIDEYNSNERGWYIYPQEETCLLCDEIASYGKGKPLYGWHISDLKIYEEPKALSEFKLLEHTKCPEYLNGRCVESKYFDIQQCKNLDCEYKTITRPPQSWCYVELIYPQNDLLKEYGVEV